MREKYIILEYITPVSPSNFSCKAISVVHFCPRLYDIGKSARAWQHASILSTLLLATQSFHSSVSRSQGKAGTPLVQSALKGILFWLCALGFLNRYFSNDEFNHFLVQLLKVRTKILSHFFLLCPTQTRSGESRAASSISRQRKTGCAVCVFTLGQNRKPKQKKWLCDDSSFKH